VEVKWSGSGVEWGGSRDGIEWDGNTLLAIG
jgi:hypothetical protein